MKQTEHQLQVAVSAYLDRALPPDAFWSSIDSAGRGPRDGARMKRRGVRRGTPDILILWQETTLWIEMKSIRGRLTPEQAAFFRHASGAGHLHTVCRSISDVEEALRLIGMSLRASVAA